MKKIVTIGGGGGHAQVLKGFKNHLKNDPATPFTITGICPNTDSGGSTGRLTEDYGTLGCVGDLTKCVTALCEEDDMARSLLHRFNSGDLDGHSVKNVLFAGLIEECGIEVALSMLWEICGLKTRGHKIIPATLDETELRAHLISGNTLAGETRIDLMAQNPLWHPDFHAIKEIFIYPEVKAYSVATESISSADCVVICPGDLYSSILPVLLPVGMKEAMSETKAHIVMVMNIMTKQGETDGYRAQDFVDRVESHLGRTCDSVLVNSTLPPEESRVKYKAMEQKVVMPEPAGKKGLKVISGNFLRVTPEGNLYHDPDLLAKELVRLI